MVVLCTLAPELAAMWFREMLIGGWARAEALAVIQYLDRAKPLERRKACVQWCLPYPVVRDPIEGLHDDEGNVIRLNQSDTFKFAQRVGERAAEKAEASARKRDAKARKAWSDYDAGLRPTVPRYERPSAAA